MTKYAPLSMSLSSDRHYLIYDGCYLFALCSAIWKEARATNKGDINIPLKP
jgi:hypothetical protein